MKNKKKLIEKTKRKFGKNPHYSDHSFPITRRGFVKLGMLAGGGIVLPSFYPQKSFGAGISPDIPFLVIDLAGGAALPGNFLVGKQGGPEDLAQDYTGNGWDPRLSGSLDRRFGIPMSSHESGILKGLEESLPEALRTSDQMNFKMASHLHFALDDQSTNKTSALTYISKAGLEGSILGTGVGQRATSSGGNSDVALRDASLRPRAIENLDDIRRLTSFGETFDQLNETQRKNLLSHLANNSSPMLSEAYEQLRLYTSAHDKGLPSNDPDIANVFNGTIDEVQAAIIYNVVMGYTGPGVITVAGCDYHNGNRQEGDRKDEEIGRIIGKAVHCAQIKSKPLFIQIITDGGMSSPSFDRAWQSDTPLRSMSVMGFFSPDKPISQRKLQLGHVVENAETDISNPISANAEKSAVASLVNYLHLSGQLDRIESTVGRLSASEIDELLIFES